MPLGAAHARPELTFDHAELDDLILPNRQLRRHPERKLQKLEASLGAFGALAPILIDAKNRIVAGAARYLAARRQGLTQFPVVRIDGLSDAQLEAYRIADNQQATGSSWDETALAESLSALLSVHFEPDALGFETAEIDNMLIRADASDEALDVIPDPDDQEGEEIRPGDVFQLGDHRLMCGDARIPAHYARLMADEVADVVITDPPFNVRVRGHVSSGRGARHEEFVMASGEMSEAEFTTFLEDSLRAFSAVLRKGGLIYAFMDWRSLSLLEQAGRANGLEHVNTIIWVKTNASNGSFYRSQHEMIALFRRPGGAQVNNIQLGRHGRNRSNVWQYAGANAFGRARAQDLADHPTVKPWAMIADALRDCTRRGDILLDPFSGSGTALIAAEKTGRRARVMELDPRYVAVALRRFERAFGTSAVRMPDDPPSSVASTLMFPVPPPAQAAKPASDAHVDISPTSRRHMGKHAPGAPQAKGRPAEPEDDTEGSPPSRASVRRRRPSATQTAQGRTRRKDNRGTQTQSHGGMADGEI